MSLFHVQEWYQNIVSGARTMTVAQMIDYRGEFTLALGNLEAFWEFFRIFPNFFRNPIFTNFLSIFQIYQKEGQLRYFSYHMGPKIVKKSGKKNTILAKNCGNPIRARFHLFFYKNVEKRYFLDIHQNSIFANAGFWELDLLNLATWFSYFFFALTDLTLRDICEKFWKFS